MGPSRLTVSRAVVAALLASLLALSGPAAAFAAPSLATPAIREKQAQQKEAQKRLADLADDAEQRVEEYNATVEALDKTRDEITANEAALVRATAELTAARTKLSDRVDSIYRSGSVGSLEMLFGTSSVNGFLARMDLMAAIGRSDADLVARVRDARFRVEEARKTLEVKQTEQVALRAEADERRKQVQNAFAKQRSYVNSLSKEIRRMFAAEAARQAKLAAERARLAKLAAAAAARRKSAGSRTTLPTGSGIADVVGIALQYVGVPYVWGGTTPNGFDCSGLAQFAYARCGISIPRTSREQFKAGEHVPADRRDLLKAGDLVFFGTHGDPGRVHHVGIYCGGGEFVHAPASGDHVRVSSLAERISSRHDYVGASRF